MTIDETIRQLREAHARAVATAAPVYLLRREFEFRPSPYMFADDVALRVSPEGDVDAVCDICGANLAPLERSDEMGEHLRREATEEAKAAEEK